MNNLEIPGNIRIPMSEIGMTAVFSQGAGGQNVNKVATAIHLRFDAFNCDAIPAHIKKKLRNLSDHRITDDGIIVIKSQAYRSQDRNRRAALNRLTELLVGATREPKRRIKTKPTYGSVKRRIATKRRRGEIKSLRGNVDPTE